MPGLRFLYSLVSFYLSAGGGDNRFDRGIAQGDLVGGKAGGAVDPEVSGGRSFTVVIKNDFRAGKRPESRMGFGKNA